MFLGERCTIARILLIIIRSLYLKGTAESTYTLLSIYLRIFKARNLLPVTGGKNLVKMRVWPGSLVGRRVQFKQRKTIVRKLSNSGFLVDQNGLISVLNHLFKHQKTLLNAETQNQAIIHHSF